MFQAISRAHCVTKLVTGIRPSIWLLEILEKKRKDHNQNEKRKRKTNSFILFSSPVNKLNLICLINANTDSLSVHTGKMTGTNHQMTNKWFDTKLDSGITKPIFPLARKDCCIF